jgi:hypothetical protein
MALRQIINGNFQSPSGVPLAFGYVTFRLSTDAVTDTGQQVSSELLITVPLDVNGNVLGTSLWPNDQLTPADTVYILRAYTAAGELVLEAGTGGLAGLVIPSGAGPFSLNG